MESADLELGKRQRKNIDWLPRALPWGVLGKTNLVRIREYVCQN